MIEHREVDSVIFNIIDRRKRQYRWKKITAIIEPTYHDNSVEDSDQTKAPGPGFFPYDQREEYRWPTLLRGPHRFLLRPPFISTILGME